MVYSLLKYLQVNYKKVSLTLLPVFLCTLQLPAQTPSANLNYLYCYSPMDKKDVPTNGNIIFYINAFDKKDLRKTVFSVTEKDGTAFTNERIIFTLNNPWPNGQILDISLNGSQAALSYISFIEGKESVSLYANRVQNGITEFAGPINIYSSRGKSGAAFEAACTLRNMLRVDTAKHGVKPDGVRSGIDTKIIVSGSGSKKAILKEELLNHFICPTQDALFMLEVANPSIAADSTIQAGTVLKLPTFPLVSDKEKDRYNEQLFWDSSSDSTQSTLFLQRSSNVLRLIESLNTSNLSQATKEADSLKTILTKLYDVINAARDAAYELRKATAVAINNELNSISYTLMYQTIKNINMGIYKEDKELLEGYTQDMDALLSAYQLTYQQTRGEQSENFASKNGPYFSGDLQDNPQLTGRTTGGDNGLRQIYFRIIKYDSAGSPITADSVVGKRYRVYCVPPGQYTNFKLHKKDLNIISAYSCQDLASLSSKNLAGTFYYFFAVSFDGIIISNEVRWNVGTITRDGTDAAHPYAYILQVFK